MTSDQYPVTNMNTNILSDTAPPMDAPSGIRGLLVALLTAAVLAIRKYLKRKAAGQPELLSRADFAEVSMSLSDISPMNRPPSSSTAKYIRPAFMVRAKSHFSLSMKLERSKFKCTWNGSVYAGQAIRSRRSLRLNRRTATRPSRASSLSDILLPHPTDDAL